MAETLYLKQMECGPMQNYVYLIGDPVTRQAAVVDPAWDVERIVQAARQDDYTISKVLITHTHQDHTGGELFGHYIPGVVELLELVDVPVYVHKTETHILKNVPASSKVPTENNQMDRAGRRRHRAHSRRRARLERTLRVDGAAGPRRTARVSGSRSAPSRCC